MRIACVLIIALVMAIMAFLGFSNSRDVRPFLPKFLHNDKVLHASSFALLTLAFYYLWDGTIRLNVILTSSIMLLTSFASEVAQDLLSNGRRFDLMDVVANIGGTLIGLLLGITSDVMRRYAKQTSWTRVQNEDIEAN